jgi:2-iminobutanoate/2-iminopropanoate deaminase
MSDVKYPMASGQTEHRLPLSMYRTARGFVFVAGHGAVDGKGEFISNDFEEQYRYTMEQLRGTLGQAGVTFADVINVRCYVQRASDIPRHNEIYREYFSTPYPSRTTIVDCLPPGLLFEIECVAVEPEQA